MENKYFPSQDLAGKLGSKKDLYYILSVDCKGSHFNPLYRSYFFLPPYDKCSTEFMKKFHAGRKKVSLRL